MLCLSPAAIKGIQNRLSVNSHLNSLAYTNVLERFYIKIKGQISDAYSRTGYNLIWIRGLKTVNCICYIIQIKQIQFSAFKHHCLRLCIRNNPNHNTGKLRSASPVILISGQHQTVIQSPGSKLECSGAYSYRRIHAELVTSCRCGLTVINGSSRSRQTGQKSSKRFF